MSVERAIFGIVLATFFSFLMLNILKFGPIDDEAYFYERKRERLKLKFSL